MKISFIVAIAKNNVIGKSNALPFYIPEDLKHFKDLTTGKTVLMGKNTFDSIMTRLGKPLPNRRNVVITHQKDIKLSKNVLVFDDIKKAINAFMSERLEELMVVGGGQIYNQLMDKADYLYVTHVDQEVDGDVFFPKVDWSKWKKVKEEPQKGFTWTEYERVK